MFCGRCGNQLPAVGQFCNVCGAPMAANQPGRIDVIRARPVKKASGVVWVLIALLVAGGAVVGALVYTGQLSGAKQPKGPPAVVGKADTENLPPQVSAFKARDARVDAGGSTELTATIVDPEQDRYFAWWTSSCGVISPRHDDPARALFLAPSTPGPCAVTLEVQDHQRKRGRTLAYTIVVGGGGS
ncbi:MAG TPA: hypothetical protein VM261_20040 [Kofleriaceae bacterium]|nr:hypothetical protein [Kofleriaceae bacterium]